MFRSQHFCVWCSQNWFDIDCVLCWWCVVNPTSGIHVLLLIATMRLNFSSFGYSTDVASALFCWAGYIMIEFLNLDYRFHLNWNEWIGFCQVINILNKHWPLTILVGTQWPRILYMGLCVCAKTGFLEFCITVFVISSSAISLSNQINGVWYFESFGWGRVLIAPRGLSAFVSWRGSPPSPDMKKCGNQYWKIKDLL